MTIPSFPCQDLAKLVLGYLAEEQLMTAYDEFLQASPYLDAHQNEFDRIFMTSLKNILAEYRAVKIFVETCKPFTLRKKIIQCTNLLEVVKLLFNLIDVNKIQDSSLTKVSSKSHTASNLNICEVCDSLKLQNCACRVKQTEVTTTARTLSQDATLGQQTSVETTSLSDLPGNVAVRKKHIKVIEKDANCEAHDTSKHATCLFRYTSDTSSTDSNPSATSAIVDNTNITAIKRMEYESHQKIEEFNDILKLVCNKNTHNGNIVSESTGRRISNAGTFQDFETGVDAENANVIVPDSSTCESISNVRVDVTKEASLSTNECSVKNKRERTKTCMVKVANVKDIKESHCSEVIDVEAIGNVKLRRIKPKGNKSKIKILSDVKVDNDALNSNLKMPPVLKNATSTPLMKMQTVVINGTPVYKPQLSNNFTKDEIMAMPTIIVTPVSGPPTLTSRQKPHYTSGNKAISVPVTNIETKSLEPLTIDVPPSVTKTFSLTTENSDSASQKNEIGIQHALIKTVDTTNNKNIDTAISASVPKDNVIAATSTPQGALPVRKSSSTPRRTSHVRVLDFTTPRRILHETINECVPNQNIDVEVIVSKSPIVNYPEAVSAVNIVTNDNETSSIDTNKCKENHKFNVIGRNKKNWDSDLRALLSNNEGDINSDKPKPKRRNKSKSKKKLDKSINDKVPEKKKVVKKRTNTKTTKVVRSTKKVIEKICIVTEDVSTQVENPVKPTINIILGDGQGSTNPETHDQDNNLKISNIEEQDTPEVDRNAVNNPTGVRLNLSAFLETPYKQALYDIQMETPRFLGDLPDDPMSDIKITNIPTPLFLNTSKGAGTTPSSYSSRPTDYSSGGSYYKPDDQDYMPLPENLGCIQKTEKNLDLEPKIEIKNESAKKNESSNRSRSRPVRQCTKNVSYYNHSNVNNKTKEVDDDKFQEDAEYTDSLCSSSETTKINKETTSKTKESNSKVNNKSVIAKHITSKKYKSPIKKLVPKSSLLKIKPRRCTPIKKSRNEQIKRKSSEFSQNMKPKSISKKKMMMSKDRNLHSMPSAAVVPAKSRRKSSTPRKLHCTKTFNSESSGHNSPETSSKSKEGAPRELHLHIATDSDNEQLPLRWSDDGSQDAKSKELSENIVNESDDIIQIQEYINTTVPSKVVVDETHGSLHVDLVKRGFDIETAKIIERDLLDTPPYSKQESAFVPKSIQTIDIREEESVSNKTAESESSVANNLQIVQDEEQLEDDNEFEFSNYECNEDSSNYFTCHHEETKIMPQAELVKLKDNYCMEVCIEDDVPIRLWATVLSTSVDIEPDDNNDDGYNQKEIEAAVRTITEINTPMKESIKAQCFEIFDSTLTSLDTPLKARSSRETEVTVTEIVLEVEKVDVKEKPDIKKRKRNSSGNTSDESVTNSKKVKQQSQYLFNSANIQNIDIESVLSKLHGP